MRIRSQKILLCMGGGNGLGYNNDNACEVPFVIMTMAVAWNRYIKSCSYIVWPCNIYCLETVGLMKQRSKHPALSKKANVKVQSFTAAPSTFTTVSGSPTKGSSSLRIPVDSHLKRVWEEVEEEVKSRWVDKYDIDEQASSSKRPHVLGQREDMNADVDGEKRPKAKHERTFKEVCQW